MKRIFAMLIAVLLSQAPLFAQAPTAGLGDLRAPSVGKAAPVAGGVSGFETGFTEEELGQIYVIADLIAQYYVDPVDRKELMYGALEGMAKKLDPHSQFFDPKAFKEFQDQLNGSFSGIGAGMKKKEKGEGLGIAYTLPGSPAEKAGLKPGDVIVAVDGTDIRPLPQEEATRRIRGAEGAPVKLDLSRDGKTLEVTLVRGKVQTANAFSRMYPGGVGYIYFESFREDSHLTVLGEARKLKGQGMRSLIIDVRNNGGGSLQSVVNLSAAFLEKGMGIVSTKNRKGDDRAWKAPSTGELANTPATLLVNGYSASASEILAGALQDNKKAVVVGSRTYGKGSAQIVIPFKDGSALKLTVDRWYAPSGRSIQKDASGVGGITPDIEVKADEEVEAKAMGQIARELNRMPVETPVPDPALSKALELFGVK